MLLDNAPSGLKAQSKTSRQFIVTHGGPGLAKVVAKAETYKTYYSRAGWLVWEASAGSHGFIHNLRLSMRAPFAKGACNRWNHCRLCLYKPSQ